MDVDWLSVPEAAQRLGVSERRVQQRIAEGSLPAERIAGRWAIPASAIRTVGNVPGRPLSASMAWGVLGYLTTRDYQVEPYLRASERRAARQSADRLRHEKHPAPLMRAWLKNRGVRRTLRAAAPDLPDLRSDERLHLSGLSQPGAGIVAGDVVEAYVSPDDFDNVISDYFLVGAPRGEANVILHVAEPLVDPSSPAVIAADLAEHNGPREDGRVNELLRGLR
jgi:excisionase family DNA binding protein